MNEKAAFSPVAEGYDAGFTHTPIGRMQRNRVWRFLSELPLEGARVLEINCGTGEDAVWLARQGASVLACDEADAMISVAKAKIAEQNLAENVTCMACGFQDLHKLQGEQFDLVFSNFGGVNCLPPEGIADLLASLQTLIRPGGRMVWVVMGRFCWWETIYFLLKFKPKAAFRRFGGGPVDARLTTEDLVKTWYYTPRQILKAAPWAEKERVQAVGCFIPPSYLQPFFSNKLGLLNGLNRMENWLRATFWATAADHFYVQLRDKNSP